MGVKFATIVGVKMDKDNTTKDPTGQEGRRNEREIELGKHLPRTLESKSMRGCTVYEMSRNKNSFHP